MNSLLKRLNFNSLLHFHVIAKHRSLRRAAAELHLSAPAVTHSLNKLEDELGHALCVRKRNEFALTPVGLELFAATQKIFNEIDQFTLRTEVESEFSGLLSIGILDHFDEPWFLKMIQEASKSFPNLKLNIQSYDSNTMCDLLLQREIDVAFGIFSRKPPRLKFVRVGTEKLTYFISDRHPLWGRKKLKKEDLVGQKVAWIDNRNRTKGDLESNIFIENPKYKMRFHGFSNNLSGALAILLSGHAVVPLSESYGKELATKYPIRKLNFDNKGRELPVEIAYDPSAILTPPVRMILSRWTDLRSAL